MTTNYQTAPFTEHDLIGYTVEKITDGGDPDMRPAYFVHGKRGARYFLMRNVPNPDRLFCINDRTLDANTKILGCTWFTDKGGRLRPVR